MSKQGILIAVADSQEGANPQIITHHNPFPVSDPWLTHAVDVVLSTYGDHISVEDKGKDLTKFGHNKLVGTASATVAHQPAGILHETFVSSNLINSIISTDNADSQELTVEGHTIDGSGDFTFIIQTATLTGQTVAALTTPLARVTRCYNSDSTEKAGLVSITETDTYSSGVPDTDIKVHLQLDTDDQQSDKASTTLSKTDYWLITRFSAELLEKSAAFAEVDIQVRLKGKVFRTQYRISGGTSHEFKPYIVVPPNSDVRLVAKANGASTEVAGGMQGVLASVEG